MSKIGFHIIIPEHFANIGDVIDGAVSKLNLSCPPKVFQIFVAEPNGFKMFFSDPEERRRFKDYVNKNDLFIVAHGRYMDIPWKGSPQIIGYIRKEMERCSELGIKGLVLHLYSTPIPNVIDSLKKIGSREDVKFYLENPASKTPYDNPHTLVKLYKELKKNNINAGFCIDSAHLWSTGVSFEKATAVKEFFSVLLDTVPASDIIIHLNDSSSEFKSYVDRHASVGMGKIWKHDKSGLKQILSYGLPVVLERGEYESNGKLQDDYDVIGSLYKGADGINGICGGSLFLFSL